MAEKLFYSMGEVSELFDVNQSLIRHWEKQFDVLRPKRNKKGNRLFSPQDVEYLKQIYHLVKERGMTLDGARKALRRHRADSGVPRDAELMERLQRIRSMLVEVREQLKETPSDEVYSDSEVEREPAVAETAEIPAAPAVVVKATAAVAAEPAAEPALVDELTAAEDEPAPENAPEPTTAAGTVKKPRRKKDDDNHELFAYYEQSLF